jgi:hypothetical protein
MKRNDQPQMQARTISRRTDAPWVGEGVQI